MKSHWNSVRARLSRYATSSTSSKRCKAKAATSTNIITDDAGLRATRHRAGVSDEMGKLMRFRPELVMAQPAIMRGAILQSTLNARACPQIGRSQ